jgi:hypothetical protein
MTADKTPLERQRDSQELLRQQADLAKEREELESMFQVLTIMMDATQESQGEVK